MRNDFENSELNETIMGEIFSENSPAYETVLLEITPVYTPAGYIFSFEIEDVRKKIEECLINARIQGIRKNSVKSRTDAEIILEFETIIQNSKEGNSYRDKIGAALKKCSDSFSQVNIEKKGKPNSFKTPLGHRYGDISFKDKVTGDKYLIETKLGNSRYHQSQRNKDKWIKDNKKTETIVVRGFKKEFL